MTGDKKTAKNSNISDCRSISETLSNSRLPSLSSTFVTLFTIQRHHLHTSLLRTSFLLTSFFASYNTRCGRYHIPISCPGGLISIHIRLLQRLNNLSPTTDFLPTSTLLCVTSSASILPD